MVYFLLGWVLGLISLLLGVFVGIYMRQIETKIEAVKKRLTSVSPPTESGAIKPYTPAQRKEMADEERTRFKELL